MSKRFPQIPSVREKSDRKYLTSGAPKHVKSSLTPSHTGNRQRVKGPVDVACCHGEEDMVTTLATACQHSSRIHEGFSGRNEVTSYFIIIVPHGNEKVHLLKFTAEESERDCL